MQQTLPELNLALYDSYVVTGPTWGNTEPVGLTRKSFVSDKIQIVKVAGAEAADGQWHEHRVEPFADYRRFWKRKPPSITAIGLMQDTDMTGGMALAEIRSLVWAPR